MSDVVNEVIGGVLGGAGDDPIAAYVESQKASYSTLIASESTQKDNHGVGNTTSRTTAADNKEAKSFRFTSGTLFDVYSPQITLNATNLVQQAKGLHTQTFHNQVSCIHNWTRSQSLNVHQSSNNYRYSTNRDFIAAANYFHQSSYHHQYADTFRLQVGQTKGTPLSKNAKTGAYGTMAFGATENITFSTKKGVISLSAQNGLIGKSKGPVSITGEKGVSISSTVGANITAKADLGISSIGPVTLSSTSFLAINSGGVMYLDAGVIYVGMGAGIKPSVNLDATPGLLGTLTSSLAGTPFTVSNVVGIASAVASGNITGAVSSLAGALVPGAPAEFLSKVSSFTPSGIASAFTGLLTGGQGLGSFLSGKLKDLFSIDKLSEALPGITDIPGVSDLLGKISESGIGPFLGFLGDDSNGFTFKSYPDIEEVDGYNSTNLPKPQGMISNNFTSEIISPVLPPLTQETYTDVTSVNEDIA